MMRVRRLLPSFFARCVGPRCDVVRALNRLQVASVRGPRCVGASVRGVGPRCVVRGVGASVRAIISAILRLFFDVVFCLQTAHDATIPRTVRAACESPESGPLTNCVSSRACVRSQESVFPSPFEFFRAEGLLTIPTRA